jgi:hypothetical protein
MFPSKIAGLGQVVLGKVTFWLMLASQLLLRDYHQQSQNATVLGLLVISGFLNIYPDPAAPGLFASGHGTCWDLNPTK